MLGRLKVGAGILLTISGFGLLLYGAIAAATVTEDGGQPFYLSGGVLVLVGLFIGSFGIWLTGMDDW